MVLEIFPHTIGICRLQAFLRNPALFRNEQQIVEPADQLNGGAQVNQKIEFAIEMSMLAGNPPCWSHLSFH
jgi:hypothetical protein